MSCRMSLRNKRIAILNDSTKYGRLTIMQQPIVHTYSLGELYTERKEKGDPSLPILTVSIHAGVSEGELDEDKLGKKVKRITDKTQYKTVNCTPFVRQYGILFRKWGVFVCQRDNESTTERRR